MSLILWSIPLSHSAMSGTFDQTTTEPGFAAESHAGDMKYLIAYVGVRHKVADHYKHPRHCLRRQLGRRYECLQTKSPC